MRLAFACALAGAFLLPSMSEAQTSLDGFGALSMNHLTSIGNSESGVPADFGGRVSFEFVPGVEGIGEFGRLGNVLPSTVALPLSFSRVGVNGSAFYGEGGIRLMAAPRSAASPYVEGSAGVAHLRFGINGLGSTGDVLARAALNLVDTSDPLVGVGGGVLMKAGALRFDVGYRYKRILANDSLSSVLSLAQNLQTHQIRFGLGVRF
jgi:opacity protein-like surface antigen